MTETFFILDVGKLFINTFQLTMVFAFCIFLHEVGHYVVLQYLSKKPQPMMKVKTFGLRVSIKDMSNSEKVFMYLAGIMFGMLPLLYVDDLFGSYAFMMCLGVYLIGCRSDIYELWRLK